MTKLKPRYRFTRIFRGFQVGDLVPEAFDEGTIGTMLSVNKIELVKAYAPVSDPALEEEAWNEPAPTIPKMIENPPADKMVKPNRKWVKRK